MSALNAYNAVVIAAFIIVAAWMAVRFYLPQLLASHTGRHTSRSIKAREDVEALTEVAA